MNQRDIFEAVCEHNIHADSIYVGWVSRYYGERQTIQLRHTWMQGGDGGARELQRFIDRLVGDPIRATHEATGDARETIRALMPIWEREIYRYMERLERDFRHRNIRPIYYGLDPAGPDAIAYLHNGRMWFGPEKQEDPKAKQKARALLMRNLDAGQLKSFEKDGTFRVTAQGGKSYTISTARSFNVKAEDGTRYCGQLADTPIEDQMLAQKLLLEHEPEKFFKNANVSPAQPAREISRMWLDEAGPLHPGGIINWNSYV